MVMMSREEVLEKLRSKELSDEEFMKILEWLAEDLRKNRSRYKGMFSVET